MDTNVIYADLPASVKAYTVCCPDDTYTIVLNSRHSHEQLLASYQHELKHIENRDFETALKAIYDIFVLTQI